MLLFGILAWFFGHYQRDYLRLGAWSWLAEAIYVGGAAVSLALTRVYGPASAPRLAVSPITAVAGLWQIAFLVMGAVELGRGTPLDARVRVRALAALVIVAKVTLIPYYSGSAPEAISGPLFFRPGLRSGMVGVGFLLGAIAAARGRRQGGLGRPLVIATLGILGVIRLHGFAMYLLVWVGAVVDTPTYQVFLGFGESGIQVLLGLGMVVWMLEEERERAMRVADEQQLLEIQLTQSQRMESIGRLAGGLAHDFNNLLTSILGYVNLARDRVPDPQARRALSNVTESAQRAAALTHRLLSFARSQHVETRVVNPNRIIRDMQDLLRMAGTRRHPDQDRPRRRRRPHPDGSRAARTGPGQPRGQRSRRHAGWWGTDLGHPFGASRSGARHRPGTGDHGPGYRNRNVR